MTTAELYTTYVQKMQRLADVRHAHAVLQWDQETYLPPRGAHYRGQQLSTLSEIAHGMFSDAALGAVLQELLAKEDLTLNQSRNVALSWNDYTKAKKYTPDFVRRMSNQTHITFHAWLEARKQNAFAPYEKDLDALIRLKQEEAALLGYTGHPYNALLDEFERGATVDFLDDTFSSLLPDLQKIVDAIKAKPQTDAQFLKQQFAKNEQWVWSMDLLKSLGFDFEAGRQDLSEHPFSTSFNAQDVRITTRVDESDFANMTWSCIHEGGHALYEQGLPADAYGLPLGEACSYSIHESQSRLWENNVGRGLPYWTAQYPRLQAHFPVQFQHTTVDQFYKGINQVQPSLIRTEADEITYHFHVYIRYELEKRLVEGSLKTAEVPAYWAEAYSKWLGITVPDDRRGCLQDVHWSHGSFGYFPTYSLGSFYAAQFFDQAEVSLPGLGAGLAQGDTTALLNWLREGVHQWGRFFTSSELCQHLTGKPLNVGYFTQYILEKYGSIYNL